MNSTIVLSTQEMLDFTKICYEKKSILEPIEANTRIGPGGALNCTHLISHVRDDEVFHEGIDSEEYKTTREEMLELYPNTWWIIEAETINLLELSHEEVADICLSL